MLFIYAFVLGAITGIAIGTLIVVIMTYFRRVIEHKVVVMEKMIENAGPRPKGFIFEPDSEAEEARAKIIDENKRQGRDTKLEDLL